MFDYIKEKEISTENERLCLVLLLLFYYRIFVDL